LVTTRVRGLLSEVPLGRRAQIQADDIGELILETLVVSVLSAGVVLSKGAGYAHFSGCGVSAPW
jgi:hypothetical protein